jgi:acyl-CoA thioester hydrolase
MRKGWFKVELRVRFNETDPAGIVHFANYLNYFAVAESEFRRELFKKVHEKIKNNRFHFPRVEVFCEYKAPARFDDLLEVYVKIGNFNNRMIKYDFEIFKKGQDNILTSGYIKCLCVNENFKPIKIPKEMIDIMNSLKG